MSTTKRTKTIIMGLILACALVSSARADKLELQQKLSKDISIRLNDVTIAEALEKIGKEAGVKFVLSDEAEWKLPYGTATRLSVVLDGPLADSMTEMLNAFFMRFAVGDQELTIYPRAELEHVIGRPSTKQLELLKDIYTKPIKVYLVDKDQETLNIALGQEVLISPMHIQAQLNNLLRQLVGKNAIYLSSPSSRRPTIRKEATETEPDQPEPTEIELPTPVTIVQLLKQVRPPDNSSYNAEWHLSRMDFAGQTPEIHVLSDTAFRVLKRRQKIDISYEEVSVDRILRDLAGRGGVLITINPHANVNETRLSVSMQNVSIEQAMRNVADMTGLLYGFRSSEMTVEGVYKPRTSTPAKPPVRNSKATSSGNSAGSGYVGKVSIPMDGGKYFVEFMLRESDLTDDLKKLRAEKLADVLGTKSRPVETPPKKSGNEPSKAGK